jgi:hypothetical protein
VYALQLGVGEAMRHLFNLVRLPWKLPLNLLALLFCFVHAKGWDEFEGTLCGFVDEVWP